MMSLTTVTFAAEDVSYFDEETGTLYMMTENWIEDLGIEETDEALFAFCEKVKIVYFGEECDTVGYCFYFYNLEEVVVDDAHANLYVYDKALYTKADNVMIYYPLASDDTDIVLSPDATYIGDSCFVDYFEQTYVNKIYGFYYHPIDKEYSLYINSVEQLQTIMNNNQRSDGTLDRLYYAKFNNIYVNGEKSKIDAVTQEVHPFDQDTWFTSATYTAFWAYMTLDYFGDINANDYFKMIDVETIMKDYLEDENFDIDEDTTEFYRVYFERVVEIWRNCEHNEVTRERFNSVLATAGDETKSVFIEHFGDLDTAYDVTHKVLESMYNHFFTCITVATPLNLSQLLLQAIAVKVQNGQSTVKTVCFQSQVTVQSATIIQALMFSRVSLQQLKSATVLQQSVKMFSQALQLLQKQSLTAHSHSGMQLQLQTVTRI